MLVPAEGFAYTKGAPKTYKRPDKADAVTREFCAVCGTHMISRRPGLRPLVLKIGTLDNPSIYGGAQKAIFTAEGQPFHLIADGELPLKACPRANSSNQPAAGIRATCEVIDLRTRSPFLPYWRLPPRLC